MKLSFSVCFQSNCVLCYTSILPGDMLARERLASLGNISFEYVHADCHKRLKDADDIQLKEYEINNIVSL